MSVNNRLVHSGEVRVALHDLRAATLEADRALLDYVATGSSQDLPVLMAAVERWRRDLAGLEHAAIGRGPEQESLHALAVRSGQAEDALTRLRRVHDERRTTGEQLAALLSAEQDMDAVQGLISEAQALEMREARGRLNEANIGAHRTLLFLGGDAAAGLLVAAALWLRRRTVRERRELEALLELARDAIFTWDPDGRILYWNRGAQEVYGWTAEEALGRNVHDLLRTRFPVAVEAIEAEVTRAGHWSGEILHRRKDGQTVVADSCWRRQRLGLHPRTVEICRDITARKQAEEVERGRTQFLLRAADELGSSLAYEEILATIAKLAVPALADWCAVDVVEETTTRRVITVHRDPEQVAAADELQRRYGDKMRGPGTSHDIIRTGQPVLAERVTHEWIAAATVNEEHRGLVEKLGLCSFLGVPLVARGKTVGALTFAMAESGRTFSRQDLAFGRSLADRAALAIENGRLFREVERARAATSMRLTEETHRRQQAEEAARFAEMFIGMLGHDLRNPLNAVMMSARLLQRRGNGDPKTIERILSSTARMSTMVQQLLDLTRTRLAGGLGVEKREIDVAALVSEVVDEIRRGDLLRHSRPGVDPADINPRHIIEWHPPDSTRAEVDGERLAQLLSNLIGNAVEHGDPSRPVDVSLSAGEHMFEIRVHNYGMPIAPDLLRVLFDPFHRTTVREKGSQGLGLGLFISQQIVLAHGGHIDVTSTAQEGTTFTVQMPRGEAPRPIPSGQGLVA